MIYSITKIKFNYLKFIFKLNENKTLNLKKKEQKHWI